MELDRRGETAVQDTCNSLPKDLYKANPSEVSVNPLQDQNHSLSGALVGERPIAKCHIHYSTHLPPQGGLCCLLLHRLWNPLAVVFRPHDQRSPRVVEAEPA